MVPGTVNLSLFSLRGPHSIAQPTSAGSQKSAFGIGRICGAVRRHASTSPHGPGSSLPTQLADEYVRRRDHDPGDQRQHAGEQYAIEELSHAPIGSQKMRRWLSELASNRDKNHSTATDPLF